MTGRYEIISISHWSFSECQAAFGTSLDEFLYFGAYPGSLIYRHDEDRFLAYIQDSIIEPVVTRDILSQFIIHKPALLRSLFYLGCEHSGQILSFNKMIGQLQDAGNTTTLAHYLTLLNQANVLTGLNKFSPTILHQRKSSPKLQVYNNALITGFTQTIHNQELKGRLIESIVGAHLINDSKNEVYYWREDNKEVDFVVKTKGKLIAIEVKSGRKVTSLSGLKIFREKFSPDALLLVGTGGIDFESFFKTPLDHFV